MISEFPITCMIVRGRPVGAVTPGSVSRPPRRGLATWAGSTNRLLQPCSRPRAATAGVGNSLDVNNNGTREPTEMRLIRNPSWPLGGRARRPFPQCSGSRGIGACCVQEQSSASSVDQSNSDDDFNVPYRAASFPFVRIVSLLATEHATTGARYRAATLLTRKYYASADGRVYRVFPLGPTGQRAHSSADRDLSARTHVAPAAPAW
jgi:hypothetical protein